MKRPELIEVSRFPSRLYAEMAQEALRREGISSIVQSDDIGVFGPTLAGTAVNAVPAILKVRHRDFERSEHIIAQMLPID